jgi:orotidine-5'-phosphate decarboxylase
LPDKGEKMGKDVIIALDFNTAAEVEAFLSNFKKPPFVKVGMELFFAEGKSIISNLKKRGCKIFLDLKCHDIPNTVKKAMSVISDLDVDITDVHASGTSNMMRSALEGLTKINGVRKTKLLAITQLTSTDEETMRKELLIDKPILDTVISYALNAKNSGLEGIVCSPFEAAKVKEVCGSHFLTITPGIRFDDSTKADQKRVATPSFAKLNGSDYIVVGRPITQATDPVAAYNRCLSEFLS